jgi:hypothetical protein
VILLALGTAVQVGAQENGLLARFRGGIGVTPLVSALNPDGTIKEISPNSVRGVSPALGPWTIDELTANVHVDGRIRVRGRGLLLAGGPFIGQNGNQRVFATLSCGTVPSFTDHNTDTAGVPLGANGDFRIDDVLNPVPFECANPVLLIRSSGNSSWFAAGIPARGEDD